MYSKNVDVNNFMLVAVNDPWIFSKIIDACKIYKKLCNENSIENKANFLNAIITIKYAAMKLDYKDCERTGRKFAFLSNDELGVFHKCLYDYIVLRADELA